MKKINNNIHWKHIEPREKKLKIVAYATKYKFFSILTKIFNTLLKILDISIDKMKEKLEEHIKSKENQWANCYVLTYKINYCPYHNMGISRNTPVRKRNQ